MKQRSCGGTQGKQNSTKNTLYRYHLFWDDKLKKRFLPFTWSPGRSLVDEGVFSHFAIKVGRLFCRYLPSTDLLERRSTKNYIHPTEYLSFYAFIKGTGHRGLNDSLCWVELTIWKCYKNCITNSPSCSKQTFKPVFFFLRHRRNRSCGRQVYSAGADQR